MKRILLTIIISLVFLVPCCAANGYYCEDVVTEEKKPEGAKCPHTTITDQKKCYDCHEIRKIDGHWKWSIKEQDHKNPKRLYEHPDWVMIVNGEAQGCFDLYGQVSSTTFRNFSESSKEDEAITMRMFQDVIHEWLAERSGTTKEKLDEMVRHKDWWMSGKAAVKEWHFADGFIK